MAKKLKIDSHSTFLPVRSDAADRRTKEVMEGLHVYDRAFDAGGRNEPPTSDTLPDECQRAIAAQSDVFVGTLTRITVEEVTERTNAMRLVMPAPLDTDLALSTIRREVAETTQRYTADLDLAYAEASRALRDLRGFEEKNRLAPLSAHYKNDTAMFGSGLVAIAIAEGGLNAFLFQEMQDQGLAGGLMVALAVSFANIFLGLGAGFLGWRLIVHVKPLLRLLGAALTGLFMAAALALHLALGDLREAITHRADAQIDFLVILQPWRWFDYTSPAPFVLFVVGIAAFVVAALKGRGGTWGVVAPYWGHDVFDRRYRAAQAVLLDAKDNLKDALANAFEGERAKLLARHAGDVSNVAEMRRLAAEAQGIARTLKDSIQAELGRLHLWLRAYRDANRQVRTTPAPAYFETYPGFEEWMTSRIDLSELTGLVSEAERMVAANSRDLGALQDLTLEEQIATIERLEEAFGKSEARAGERIARDDAAALRLRQA